MVCAKVRERESNNDKYTEKERKWKEVTFLSFKLRPMLHS